MEAGGEISSPAAAPGGTLTDRLGGTSCRPADRQDAAAPLGGYQGKDMRHQKNV